MVSKSRARQLKLQCHKEGLSVHSLTARPVCGRHQFVPEPYAVAQASLENLEGI